jgi:predicted Zn-dependent protease with MMP-like domain
MIPESMPTSRDWRLKTEAFEQVVAEAIDALPDDFARLLDNVAIVVEEEPTSEDLEGDDEEELLGIYRGVPLPERGFGDVQLPDQIALFRQPILRVSESRSEAIEEIRDTLIHELGHFFGLDDEEMPF